MPKSLLVHRLGAAFAPLRLCVPVLFAPVSQRSGAQRNNLSKGKNAPDPIRKLSLKSDLAAVPQGCVGDVEGRSARLRSPPQMLTPQTGHTEPFPCDPNSYRALLTLCITSALDLGNQRHIPWITHHAHQPSPRREAVSHARAMQRGEDGSSLRPRDEQRIMQLSNRTYSLQ